MWEYVSIHVKFSPVSRFRTQQTLTAGPTTAESKEHKKEPETLAVPDEPEARLNASG
jgi:hypothetical protein